MRKIPREHLLTPALLALLAAACLAGLLTGAARLAPAELWRALSAGGDDPFRLILLEVRLPRVALAALVGAALGMSGAAMQGFLKNPLADPGVLGISNGAALGAVAVFYTGLAGAFPLALPLAGVAGAFVAALLLLLAGRDAAVHTMILAGLALNALLGALITLCLNLSPNPFANMEIMFWLMGSLADRGWPHVGLALPFVLLGGGLLLSTRPALRALSLGEAVAGSLGFEPRRTRLALVAGATLCVGAGVAVAGAIGFVGLVAPHLLRPAVRGDPGRLLPASALGGAVLLVSADTLTRLIPTNMELKVGVVTALLGAPFFLALLVRSRKFLS
jgi:iron complex transport system permease protein